LKGKVLKQNALISGAQTFAIGAGAAALAYGIGALIQRLMVS